MNNEFHQTHYAMQQCREHAAFILPQYTEQDFFVVIARTLPYTPHLIYPIEYPGLGVGKREPPKTPKEMTFSACLYLKRSDTASGRMLVHKGPTSTSRVDALRHLLGRIEQRVADVVRDDVMDATAKYHFVADYTVIERGFSFFKSVKPEGEVQEGDMPPPYEPEDQIEVVASSSKSGSGAW